jgi:multiple sugar transport system ATP-binding protein
MADLELVGLQKFYGDVHAVRDIGLKVASGEFVVLVGPSGCGKSTLLRMIAGLEEVSAGKVILKDRDITFAEPRDRDIAMVFQSYALYPYLTVYENMAFGLKARRVAKDEVRRRVMQAAEKLHITDWLGRYPRALSGGQRQRVAIGRAIVRDAELYLFDEPLSNLDAKLRDGMREELKRLHQEVGKTFIYVTHDQIEAMTLADRIVLLKGGQIAQSGAPIALFERPATRFVAEFLGSPQMNMIPCTIVPDGEGIALSDGRVVPFDGSHASPRPEPGRQLLLGVRPEHFGTAGPGGLVVRIEVVQPTGSRSFGSFRLGGAHVVAEFDANSGVRVGERVPLTIAMDRTVLFDPDAEDAVSYGRAAPQDDRHGLQRRP